MIYIEVRRNGSILALLSSKDVPTKGTRMIFGGHEYEVIAIKRFYKEDLEIDMPQVHVNHVRAHVAE